MNKIRAIVKRPNELIGHELSINNALKTFQNIVGGYIEVGPIGGSGAVMICNEEGKLLGLPYNFRKPNDIIVGTVIVVGTSGAEFTDCPLTLDDWAGVLNEWGDTI